jgi:hypothetical protein
MAEWLSGWLQTTCPSPLWVRIPTGTLDSFMWGSYSASLRKDGGSTQVPVRAWNNARKGTWGLHPPVKLERRDMTYTVSMWCKTPKQKKDLPLPLILPLILESHHMTCWYDVKHTYKKVMDLKCTVLDNSFIPNLSLLIGDPYHRLKCC